VPTKTKIPFVQIYHPHPKQLELHQSPARFKVVNFGRRSGKSTFAQNYILTPNPVNNWPLKGALQVPGRYWIVAPTYTQAKSVYWRGLMFSTDPGNTTAIPREVIAKVNENELIITLINGSTLELKGADNPDSLRGAGIKGVVLDEYAFWRDPTAWEYVIQPALSDSGGWAVFISTPNGFNHFYDISEFAKAHNNWSYHHATIYDNPNIQAEEKERLREELDEDTWAQEYLGEFRKMQGLVYPEFQRSTHVFDMFDPDQMEKITGKRKLPLGGDYALGVDPGLRDQLGAVFFFIDYDDNYYLLDEIYERDLDTDAAYRRLKQKIGSDYYSTRVADSASAQFIKDMNSIHGLGLTAVSKEGDSIPEGIRLCKQQLKVQEGTGRPKLFVASHCKNFINEIEGYRYPPEEVGKNPKVRPIDANNHLMDAWRYVRLTLFRPSVKPASKFKKIYHKDTGRIIGYEKN
jgi:terminase large subunit-like protein